VGLQYRTKAVKQRGREGSMIGMELIAFIQIVALIRDLLFAYELRSLSSQARDRESLSRRVRALERKGMRRSAALWEQDGSTPAEMESAILEAERLLPPAVLARSPRS
jgi:hypothetical protein